MVVKDILRSVSRIIPDKLFLHLKYYLFMRKKLNIKFPCTYTEKIQWLKLYDRNPIYTLLVDKYEVKKWVAERIGEEHIIPTYGVWDRFEDIEFEKLPEQFVLKCTHDSGGLVICKSKSSFDIEAARKKISKCLRQNYYWQSREWPYRNVRPRIIAEKYMEDEVTGELRDYKFFAFDGKVKMLFVATDRQTVNVETKFDFFDTEFRHLNIRNGHPNALCCPVKPQKFELMMQLAEKLAADLPHVRVDFYEVNGELYFGEMTLYHWSGMMPFDPPEWDEKIGSWINLPEA